MVINWSLITFYFQNVDMKNLKRFFASERVQQDYLEKLGGYFNRSLY